MDLDAYREEVKFRLTGGVLDLEIDDVALDKVIDMSFREILRYIDTTELLSLCCKDFEKGFIEVLKTNKEYLESKEDITDNDTLNCFKYYLSNK